MEETDAGGPQYKKKPFWQKQRPESFVVEKERMTLAVFIIPMRRKGWKGEKLFRLIRESAEGHPLYTGSVRILMQPRVQLLLTEREGRKKNRSGETENGRKGTPSDTFLPAAFFLGENILRERFPVQGGKTVQAGPESVVLLLGTLFFPEEQIRHFAEMIGPYLQRVNALTVLCEAEEEAAGEYTEELYYEYGLVSQIICGTEAAAARLIRRGGQSLPLFLDYGYSGTMPYRMLKEGGIYLDIASAEEKEALFRRKYRNVFYQSPRKYLDTMVKSGYDK